MKNNTKEHWEKIYQTKAEDEVSWFQPQAKISFEFLKLFDLPLTANIIDIGGGDSHFVDALLDKGFLNIWVLDISSKAIEKAKERLGEKASLVQWIVTDVTEFKPIVEFDLWHDRATFHFLTADKKIDDYIFIARNAIKKDGHLTIGTFSETGPEKCSGLEIKRYSESALSARFEFAFEKIKCIREDHKTPFDTVQNFLFCGFKKKQ